MFFTRVPKYFLPIRNAFLTKRRSPTHFPPLGSTGRDGRGLSVVEYGTGQRSKALGRPVAGKTGTSSDFADAWFLGYTPSLLTSVWVGFDDKTSMGENETGARAALPVWVSFMRQALRNGPVEDFEAPDEIALVRASIKSRQTTSDEVLADPAPPNE